MKRIAIAALLLASPALTAELPDTFWYDGFAPAPEGQGLDDACTTLGEYNGELIAGGHFTSGGGTPLNHIGLWDGTSWAPLGIGVNDAPLVFTTFEGDLIAGGMFTQAGGQPAVHVARWDGTAWQPMGQGMNDEVRALCVYGGELYAGGEFLIAGGQLVAYVARWNGIDWQPVGNGFNGKVEELVEYGGQLIAVGTFDQAEGQIAKHIAVWDGMSWTELGGGTSARIRAAVVADSSLYVGGEFDTAGTTAALRVARWDGAQWNALGDGLDGEVLSLTRYNDTLVATGDFIHAGIAVVGHVSRWTGETWLELEGGVGSSGNAAATVGGALFVGGEFITAGENPSTRIARWGDGADGLHYVPAEFYSMMSAAEAPSGESLTDVVLAPGTYGELSNPVMSHNGDFVLRGCGAPEETRVHAVEFHDNNTSVTLRNLLVEESTSILTIGWFGFRNCAFEGTVGALCTGSEWAYADSCRFAKRASFKNLVRSVSVSNSRAYDGLHVDGGEDANGTAADCWIQGGLTIRGGEQFGARAERCSLSTGDITISSSDVLVANCVVLSGGIRVSQNGDPERLDVTVVDNVVAGSEFGIDASWLEISDPVEISGNTVVNASIGIVATGAVPVAIERNIIAGCDTALVLSTDGATIVCNTLWANDFNASGVLVPIGSDGNIEANPWFCDTDEGDYRLTAQSPCLPGNHPDGAECGLIGALGEGCTLRADLVPSAILCTPDTTFWSGDGDSVAIGAVVTNTGRFPSEPSFVRVEVTGCIGFYGDTRPVTALQPGESDTAWVGPFTADLTACEVDVTVDYFDDVLEGDEGNNAEVDATPCTVVGVDDDVATVRPLGLRATNPLLAGSRIEYWGRGVARLDIFDTSGRLVRSWRADNRGGSLPWDGRDEAGRPVASGRYFLRLVGDSDAVTRAITVLR